MRKLAFLSILVVVTISVGGCLEDFAIFGAGAAGQDTLRTWQENLDIQKAELQKKYDLVMEEIENAPDPNALALAKKKLDPILQQRLANTVALETVTSILKVQDQEPGQDKTDAVVTGAFGIGFAIWQFLSRRKLNTKYIAHKAGQATFEISNPEPAKILYANIGTERVKRGL